MVLPIKSAKIKGNFMRQDNKINKLNQGSRKQLDKI